MEDVVAWNSTTFHFVIEMRASQPCATRASLPILGWRSDYRVQQCKQAGHLVRLQDPQPQKINIRAAIHLSLEELEPVDMTLCLAIAPWQLEGRPHSR